MLFDATEKSLASSQNQYAPAPIESLVIDINRSDTNNIPKIKEKEIKELAKNIIRYYLTLRASIIITRIQINGKKYIFDVQPSQGTRVRQIYALAGDVQQLMQMEYFKVIQDELTLRIIVSKNRIIENSLLKILESSEFKDSDNMLPYAIGYNIIDEMKVIDLDKLKHLLIAGSSNSRKSVALECPMTSLVYKYQTGGINILVLDFGVSNLDLFNVAKPLLSHPVIKDKQKDYYAIMDLEKERARRLAIIQNNTRQSKVLLPIVCIIDEFPAFLFEITNRKESKALKEVLARLLNTGRHTKIHLILAAQDPTKENMNIKGINNITARIALKCSTHHHSQTIIGQSGAEELFGKGDMLFKSEGTIHIQGAYIPEKDIKFLLEKMDFNYENPNKFEINISDFPKPLDDGFNENELEEDEPKLTLADVIMWALSQREISNKAIMNKYQIGYEKANVCKKRLIDLGLIPKTKQRKPVEVIPDNIQDLSDTVISILKKQGLSEDKIPAAFEKRWNSPNTIE